MARPKNLQPGYKHHRPTNTARCYVGGRWVSLGRYGSPESRREHARILATLAAAPEVVPGAAPSSPAAANAPSDLTIAELLAAFMLHARGHYRDPDGNPTSEVHNFAVSLRPLRERFGTSLARDFGPKSLKAVRERMIAAGWCRKQINKHVSRIKLVFKWAASEELIPAAVFHGLQTVAGLQKGRSAATEREPVAAVRDADVEATLPHLNRHVAGLVRFQRLTGCRPAEACRVRVCDLDTTGDVWVYRPAHHKSAHRGRDRAIAVGPNARTLIEGFATGDPTAYLFSPRRAVAESRAKRAAARTTPRYPSSVRPRKENPKRQPAERYRVSAYDHAIAKAARKAGVPRWSPNQLRHAFATRVRAALGLEAAQVALGHARADVTQVYAEKNLALAAVVATKIG